MYIHSGISCHLTIIIELPPIGILARRTGFEEMSAILKKATTAVITGGASGIGLALARKCVGYGMRVLVADWDVKGLDAAKESLGKDVSTVRVDVSKVEDWSEIKSRVAKEFGGM